MIFMAGILTSRKVKMAASLLVVATLWTTAAIAEVNEDLIEAAQGGDLVEVNRLLDKGADVNAKDNNGKTAQAKARRTRR